MIHFVDDGEESKSIIIRIDKSNKPYSTVDQLSIPTTTTTTSMQQLQWQQARWNIVDSVQHTPSHAIVATDPYHVTHFGYEHSYNSLRFVEDYQYTNCQLVSETTIMSNERKNTPLSSCLT